MHRNLTTALASMAFLAGCSTPPDSAPASTETMVSAITVSSINFDDNFTAPAPSSPLVAGGFAELQFEADRFYQIVDEDSPNPAGHFANSYHCYGYGCCAVDFSTIQVHYRFDEHSDFTADEVGPFQSYAIQLPENAERLELYFATDGFDLRSWYCDSVGDANESQAVSRWIDHAAYDSQFGNNYVFDVEAAAEPLPVISRLADGEWQSGGGTHSGYRYGWYWDANVWIDLSVEASDEAHSAGVRWTTNGWTDFQDTPAHFERTLDGGREQWGVDIAPALHMTSCHHCEKTPGSFEYALFYTVGNHTYWDNNDGANYQVVLPND